MSTKDEVLRLKRKGLKNTEIAATLNVSRQYVSFVWQTSQHNNTRTNELTSKNILTVGDASRLLGVHQSTIRRWSDEGKIPSFRVRIGRMDRRFKSSDLVGFITSGTMNNDEAYR
jgi:excisionase family DNA binding protein